VEGERRYEIVLFGAGGFTGALTAAYLAEHAPAGTRWALAGREPAKLERLRERLSATDPACARLPLLSGDASEPGSMRALAASSRVVISAVGPYLVHGEPLVAACAEAGTDYIDLAGESEFVDLMYVRHHEQACANSARIVHSCGFVSAAHDLGAYFTVQHLPEDVPIRVEAFLRLELGTRARHSFSAGSMRSALTMYSRPRQSLIARRTRRAREARRVGRRVRGLSAMPRYERPLSAWVLPAPTIDGHVVRRSASALARYGPAFSYGQYLVLDRGSAVRVAGGVTAAVLLAQLAPVRNALLNRLSSGTGPALAQREGRWFKLRFVGKAGGHRVVTEVSGGDPGYGEAAKMLAEAALSLAFDELPPSFGQLTPAVAMGDALIDRLRRRDISFSTLV
jgi:saccharopine dehydrogenase (NAD+, L-glutamate forming)